MDSSRTIDRFYVIISGRMKVFSLEKVSGWLGKLADKVKPKA